VATSAWVPLLCGQPVRQPVSHPVSDGMAGLGGFSVGIGRDSEPFAVTFYLCTPGRVFF
jgi:hypothetical protein